MTKADDAIGTYLTALRDPAALIDDGAIEKLSAELDSTDDPIARIEIRQQLIDAKTPPLDKVEAAFVEHDKAWAEKGGISPEAMVAEGVDERCCARLGSASPAGAQRFAYLAVQAGDGGGCAFSDPVGCVHGQVAARDQWRTPRQWCARSSSRRRRRATWSSRDPILTTQAPVAHRCCTSAADGRAVEHNPGCALTSAAP